LFLIKLSRKIKVNIDDFGKIQRNIDSEKFIRSQEDIAIAIMIITITTIMTQQTRAQTAPALLSGFVCC
jgi:hypothetical protein